MWTTSRTTYCSRRTWSIIRCSPLQDTVPSKSKVILRFTRKSKDQQGQPSTKMLRFWWSTTTSSARCQCPLSLTSSRLNTTWRRMARKVSIWSSTASKNRARPTIWSLWTSTCPSVTGSSRLKWSETIWKSKRIRAYLLRSSPTSASSLLSFRQFHKWQRSSQLSMSTRFSPNRYSKQEFSNYFWDQVYSRTE